MADDPMAKSIQEQTEVIFHNMSISMCACGRETLICGAPAWRYFYDKWFVNPQWLTKPAIHMPNRDKVDLSCGRRLSNAGRAAYFTNVKKCRII